MIKPHIHVTLETHFDLTLDDGATVSDIEEAAKQYVTQYLMHDDYSIRIDVGSSKHVFGCDLGR